MKPNYPNQIITLWVAFLLTLLFHTDLGLMPLFHGQSVAHSQDTTDISWLLWLMLLFFLPPLLGIMLPSFTNSRKYRIAHFWLTVLYSFLNLSHLIADLLVTPIAWYQIALMAILCLIGFVLNIVSYRWMMQRHLT
jgi:putative effector of murein hydrolase LrgA (UPF0299 family)